MSNRISKAEVSSLTKIGGGDFVIVNAVTKRPKWKANPWRTEPSWNAGLSRWEVRMYPGFVNGEDPACHGYLPEDDLAKRLKLRAVDLADLPWMVPSGWRTIDGTGEPIPKYFQALGVRKQVDFSVIGEKIVIDGTAADPSLPPLRSLQAVDYWVSVARPTYQMSVAIVGNVVTGQLVDYQVQFNTDAVDSKGTRPRLESGVFPSVNPISFQDRLSGIFEDEGEDRVKICTVYLLSPPDKVGLAPDGSWRGYVKHECFWNLMHAAKNDPPRNTPQAGVDTGLAALVGRYTIVPAATAGAMEAEIQRKLAALLNTTSNEGRFWSI